MTFTLENTKDAAGYSLYCRNINFYKEVTNDGFLLFSNFNNGWSQELGVPTLAVAPLSRPHNETREFWTTNGVTQYAQPQGNDIDWIHGSEYYKPSTKEFFRMPQSGNHAEYYSHQAQDWKINASVPVSNLSRSYFIKRIEWPSCDSQEDIGPGVEVFTEEFLIGGGKNVLQIYKPGKLLFKGAKFSVFVIEGGREYSRKNTKLKSRPIQTAEDKLREKLKDIWIQQPDRDAIFDAMLDNDEFTITLKGE